jgi:hypothetical protein
MKGRRYIQLSTIVTREQAEEEEEEKGKLTGLKR